MRKKIAVLAAQIDEENQKRFLTEFIKEAYALDYDVCIFSMYQKYQETWLRNIGDSNIFELVNYDLFDAVLIMADTILTPGMGTSLQKKVKESFHGPVLVVDQESPYFESVMMDHYTPEKKLIDHLIEVHGFTRIAFLGGKKGHPHSVQRIGAFRDSMRSHGLEIKKDWIYHGNYWYDSGEKFADILLKDPSNLPQAIACANDCMAIGAAARLNEEGIRIPEDMAVIGYDSIQDGRRSPKPITSASIPAGECGAYCLKWLDAALSGREKPVFKQEAHIFIGASCGCDYVGESKPKKLRSVWGTQLSSRGIFSEFNHITEDLLSQSDFRKFLKTVKNYSSQIEPFKSFDICMNEAFLEVDGNIGENAIRKGYSDTIYHVLSCGRDSKDEIDFERSFPVKKLLPELSVERAYPTAYIFNPLYFDDRCFGYTVLNYGEGDCLYDNRFRIWMKNIMQGMESFYRQQYLQDLIKRIKAGQVRDGLTGLYNYEGFIRQIENALDYKGAGYKGNEAAVDGLYDKKIGIVSFDIKGISKINEIYGRDYGEKAIMAAAGILQKLIKEDEICCRMCNDEFLAAVPDEKRAKKLIQQVKKSVKDYRLLKTSKYTMDIYAAYLEGPVEEEGSLETVINSAISIKNHKKHMADEDCMERTDELMDEIKRNQLVSNILDNNLLTYYYQPIVSSSDGSIYAYEALMRYEKEKISPLQIIQAAAYLGRLPDIERATFLNVTKDVEDNLETFRDAKVFLNSLPGLSLSKEDDDIFVERMKKNKGRFVIELTEESELNNEQLVRLKLKYDNLGNEIALDDYGAGYSNVNNLLRYMPRYVKIDRQLISGIENNPQKQHFVRSIIQFAHNNDIIALAEGVETKEELKMCINLGVELIQGYYTGRPQREPVKEIDVDVRDEIKRFHIQSREWQSMYLI